MSWNPRSSRFKPTASTTTTAWRCTARRCSTSTTCSTRGTRSESPRNCFRLQEPARCRPCGAIAAGMTASGSPSGTSATGRRPLRQRSGLRALATVPRRTRFSATADRFASARAAHDALRRTSTSRCIPPCAKNCVFCAVRLTEPRRRTASGVFLQEPWFLPFPLAGE